MNPLCVIPTFMHKPEHVQLLRNCLTSLRDHRTDTEVDILMVDDCSPLEGKSEILKAMAEEFDAELHEKPINTGFSQTVNRGIMQAHLAKQDCVLVNMDVEFMAECPDWLNEGLADPAMIVGARLLYANGIIQHGGVYFSLQHRYWDHLYRYGPFNLPEANVRRNVPVTGALQIIKWACIDQIGYYDEAFKMAYEDVDYCCRAMLPPPWGAGLEVAYNPKVMAYHHESVLRGGQKKYSLWHDESFAYFMQKYATTPLQMFIPPLDRDRSKSLGELHPKRSALPVGLLMEAAKERESGDRPPVAAAADAEGTD